MPLWGELLVGLAIAFGLVTVVAPVLPGLLIEWVAILVWAVVVGGSTAWIAFAVVTVVLAAGTVVKVTVPGGKLRSAGIPSSTLWVGGLLGVVGFFVVPVIGLFLGFVLGVYLAEVNRLGSVAAWPSTRQALAAVAQSIAIEFAAGLVAAVVWLTATLYT